MFCILNIRINYNWDISSIKGTENLKKGGILKNQVLGKKVNHKMIFHVACHSHV